MALECRVGPTWANPNPREPQIHRILKAVGEVKPQVTKANVRIAPNVTVILF